VRDPNRRLRLVAGCERMVGCERIGWACIEVDEPGQVTYQARAL
jgi:hypothetical protein